MERRYLDLGEIIAADIDEGRRRDPKNFMRRSRVRSARTVILKGWASIEDAQAMYNVEFTPDELDEVLALQAQADTHLEPH
jgi:hypothetical protein